MRGYVRGLCAVLLAGYVRGYVRSPGGLCAILCAGYVQRVRT